MMLKVSGYLGSAGRLPKISHDVLIDRFDGRPLNAPNDVVVAADGAVWFTDPGYGIDGPYEGHKADAELPRSVYRLDPASGAASVVAEAALTTVTVTDGEVALL